MTDPPDDPRINVNFRLRRSSVARVDTIARSLDWRRSDVLRVLFVLGLTAWDRGERP
jgi:hypothetical protein